MTTSRSEPTEPRLVTPAGYGVIAAMAATAAVVAAVFLGAYGDWFLVAAPALFIALLVSGVLNFVQQRRDHLQRHQIDCRLRLVGGSCTGLDRRWQSGAAVVAPGQLRFRRTLGGVRFLPGHRLTLDVARVGSIRRPRGWRAVLSAAPGDRVMQILTSGGATIEVAVLAGEPSRSIDRLQVPTDETEY